MIWKILGLQKKLDALFDDGWVSLGISNARGAPYASEYTLPYSSAYAPASTQA